MRTVRSTRNHAGYRRASRSIRKSELSFSYALGDSISFLKSDDWDTLTRDHPIFLSRAYLAIMESKGHRALHARYGIIYRQQDPVAAIVTNSFSLPGDAGFPDTSRNHRDFPMAVTGDPKEGIPTFALAGRSRKVLLCGDYYTGGFHGIAIDPALDFGTLWPAITRLLQKIQLGEGFSRSDDYILIKDVPATLSADPRALRQCHYRRTDTSPNMVLVVPERCTSYEDYLGQLNVRHRLVAHRVARELHRHGYFFRTLDELGPWIARLHELYVSVQRLSGENPMPMPPELLVALAEGLGPAHVRCSGLFQGDDLLGFTVTLIDRDQMYCYCLGYDTEMAKTAPLLQALLHGVARDGIDTGCRQINFGRTALRAKAQLGAHPDQTELWVQHAQPELDVSMASILDTVRHAPAERPSFSLSRTALESRY